MKTAHQRRNLTQLHGMLNRITLLKYFNQSQCFNNGLYFSSLTGLSLGHTVHLSDHYTSTKLTGLRWHLEGFSNQKITVFAIAHHQWLQLRYLRHNQKSQKNTCKNQCFILLMTEILLFPLIDSLSHSLSGFIHPLNGAFLSRASTRNGTLRFPPTL